MEEKFLRLSLDASRDIKVDSIRIDAQHTKETRPSDLDALLKPPGKYDVYILGDIDASAFRTAGTQRPHRDGQCAARA